MGTRGGDGVSEIDPFADPLRYALLPERFEMLVLKVDGLLSHGDAVSVVALMRHALEQETTAPLSEKRLREILWEELPQIVANEVTC